MIDKKKLKTIAAELRKASAMHKGQAAKIDKMLKSIKPMPKKKKYFPNNWSEYKNAPDEMFLDHTFQELLDWKVLGWELPSSVSLPSLKAEELPVLFHRV